MAKKVDLPECVRPLHEIAAEITREWPKVYFGAVPYLRAMQSLETVYDHYGDDDGRGIVLYFLSNANTWRGNHARRIKTELKAHLAGASLHPHSIRS